MGFALGVNTRVDYLANSNTFYQFLQKKSLESGMRLIPEMPVELDCPYVGTPLKIKGYKLLKTKG
jgi:hypothetical protein